MPSLVFVFFDQHTNIMVSMVDEYWSTVAFELDYEMQIPYIHNIEEISGPKQSIKIPDHFTCISANVIYWITCILCKALYIGEVGRQLVDRFQKCREQQQKHI